MLLLEECQEYFSSNDLYEIFRIKKDASAAEVKKAYYKISMICHPDKAGENESAKKEATVRFQLISKIYSVLSDKEKRAIYDETGAVDDENVLSDEDSVNLWRKVFKKVTKEDIEKFFEEYKGSNEEINDIIDAYNKHDGEFNIMLQYIMHSSFEEETRIKEIIKKSIKDGILKATKKWKISTSKSKTALRAKKARKEAKEADQMLKEIEEKEGTTDLRALILKRHSNRNDFYDSLAEKYAPKPKRGKK